MCWVCKRLRSNNVTSLTVTDAKDRDEVLDRIRHEDQLVNTRSSLVLAMNGLAAIAMVLPNGDPIMKVVVGFVTLVVDVLWLRCACSAHRFIFELWQLIHRSQVTTPSERLRDAVRKNQKLGIDSTIMFCVFLPLLLIFGWLAGSLISL